MSVSKEFDCTKLFIRFLSIVESFAKSSLEKELPLWALKNE